MNLSFLKTLRVIISLLFFISVGFIFLDIKEILPEGIIDAITFLQFVPSLLNFFGAALWLSFGWIIIFLITAFFGRVYCSTICPLGTFQDIIAFLKRKTTSKKKLKKLYHFTLPHNLWRYGILTFTLIVLFFGSTYVLLLLDPYSNFGRFMTNFIKPVIIGLNNGISYLALKANLFTLYPFEARDIHVYSIIWPVIILITITWMSVKYGRLFCNTLCPVGSFLAFLSKLSLYKIEINDSLCNHCKKCSNNCKANCIDHKHQFVDFDRCIACFNCFNECDKNAFYFSNRYFSQKENDHIDNVIKLHPVKRRGFFMSLFSMIFISAGFQLKAKKDSVLSALNVESSLPTEIPEDKQNPVFPPGAKKVEHFNSYCTACSLCVSVCPNHVLQPALEQYGLIGFMQPHMDYSSGYCNYECKLCSEVCPTGAIQSIQSLENKKTIQMGKANFIKENCVVYTDNTDCGACSEHCPTKAVDMVPYEDTGLFIPEIDEDICVGCGACEYPCPTRPYKAIFVDGNPEHLIAETPEIKELEIVEQEEDFPF